MRELSEEQIDIVIAMSAAGYSCRKVNQAFTEHEWDPISYGTFQWYRQNYSLQIQQRAKERRDSAALAGLAHREERVLRLIAVAEEMEERGLFATDSRGRFPLLSEYLNYMKQIQDEVGQKVTRADITRRDVQELRVTVERFTEQRKSLDEWMTETFGSGGETGFIELTPRKPNEELGGD